MKFTLTRLPKSEVEISVTIPPAEFEPHLKRAAALISEEIEIDGFRKGKAPYEAVKNHAGEGAIYERAAELAARKTYPEILQELITSNQLPVTAPPIGRPEVTVAKLAPGDDLEYKVRTAILPPVALPDCKTIARRAREEKKEQTVSEEEIDQAIRWLRDSRTQLITVDRPAAEGDRVEVDFEIRPAGSGTKIAGGESKNHPVVIGRKRFIPGFEEALSGMKSGERKSFTLLAPDDWREKQFAGKALDFTAVMRLVQERRTPEENDEFARGLGAFSTIDALRSSVREGLFGEKTDKERQRIRGLIVSEIAEEAKIEPPEVLIQAEIDKMIAELKNGVAEMHMQWSEYLLHIGKTEESMRSDWRGEAERRARITLTLGEIALREKITPSEEEVTDRANQFLGQFKTAQETDTAIDPGRLREYTKGVLRNEKIFEFLETI